MKRIEPMKELVEQIFRESIKVKEETLKANLESILQASNSIIAALKDKRKVMFFGNGGSAADSQHIAAELIGRFQRERPSLAAIALTTDTSILTALGNDYGFDVVFARQIEGIGHKGDVAFAISTSGNSTNVLAGVRQAKKMGMTVIALTGCGGGELARLSDINLIVPSHKTARIQESHICMAHVICELVENEFSEKNS